MRKFLIAAAMAAVLGGAGAKAEESSGQLGLGTDVGQVDNDIWETTYFRPYVSFVRFEPGLSYEGRLRVLVTQDQRFDDGSEDVNGGLGGFDLRYMLGWSWKLSERTQLGVLGGITFDQTTTEVRYPDEDIVTRVRTTTWAADAELVFKDKLTDRFDWVSQVVGGPLFSGKAKTNADAEDDGDVNNGYRLELRTGLDYHLTESLLLQVGAVYERFHADYKNGARENLREFGLQLGLALKF